MTPITEEVTEDATLVPVEPEVTGEVPVAEAGDAAPVVNAAEVQAVAERELRGIVEALLFVAPEPLTIQRLLSVIGDVSKADLVQALKGLGEELDREGRGIRLAELAGGYRLVTKQEHAAWIKRLDKSKSTAKLSRSALESLAIIAYKQPIVKSEIEEIRGVETSGVVRTLLERKLVRIVGRKEVPGRPIMYGTTKFFLEHFGLNDLTQLPPLREFKELGESEQSMLPMEAGELATGEVETLMVGEAQGAVEAIGDVAVEGEAMVEEVSEVSLAVEASFTLAESSEAELPATDSAGEPVVDESVEPVLGE